MVNTKKFLREYNQGQLNTFGLVNVFNSFVRIKDAPDSSGKPQAPSF